MTSKSWSKIVSSNIPIDVANKLAEENHAFKQREEQAHAIYLKNNYGHFWYFKVEAFDKCKIACDLRNNPENIQSFKQYLINKYHNSWLDKSEDTEDDCMYLSKLRYEKEKIEEANYYRQLEEQAELDNEWKRKYDAEEKEKENMKKKLASGNISLIQFKKWQIMKDLEEYEKEEAYDDGYDSDVQANFESGRGYDYD